MDSTPISIEKTVQMTHGAINRPLQLEEYNLGNKMSNRVNTTMSSTQNHYATHMTATAAVSNNTHLTQYPKNNLSWSNQSASVADNMCYTPGQASIPDYNSTQRIIPEYILAQGSILDYTSAANSIFNNNSVQNRIPEYTTAQSSINDCTSAQSNTSDYTLAQGSIPEYTSAQNRISDYTSVQNRISEYATAQSSIPDNTSAHGGIPEYTSTLNRICDFTSAQNTISSYTSLPNRIPEYTTAMSSITDYTSAQDRILAQENIPEYTSAQNRILAQENFPEYTSAHKRIYTSVQNRIPEYTSAQISIPDYTSAQTSTHAYTSVENTIPDYASAQRSFIDYPSALHSIPNCRPAKNTFSNTTCNLQTTSQHSVVIQNLPSDSRSPMMENHESSRHPALAISPECMTNMAADFQSKPNQTPQSPILDNHTFSNSNNESMIGITSTQWNNKNFFNDSLTMEQFHFRNGSHISENYQSKLRATENCDQNTFLSSVANGINDFKLLHATSQNFTSSSNTSVIPGDSIGPARSGKKYVRKSKKSPCECSNCKEADRLELLGEVVQRDQHSCPIPGCGKEYKMSSHLKAHMRWHANDRPFTCKHFSCAKQFGSSDELQKHLKYH